MKLRRFMIEGATLIISAIILGLVANAMASSDRQVSLAAAQQAARQTAGEPQQEVPHNSSIIEDDAVTTTETSPSQSSGTVAETPVPAEQSPTTSRASKSEILEKFPPSPDVPAEEIHTNEAYWLWQNGALFLDARRTSTFNEGHIAGARSVAVWEADVDEKVKSMSEEGLDTNMPVVIYCSGGACEDSHMLAQKLWGMFFNNLRVYYEGYPGWTDAGYPVKQGPKP